MERWKEVSGYEGFYWVSDYGRIKSLRGIRRLTKNNKGYPLVTFSVGGKRKTYSVHRLVAKAFVENTNDFDCVNHIDSNPSNNYYTNLEWCTMSYNTKYAIENGRFTHHVRVCENNNKKREKRVGMFDKNGELITEFESMAQASKYINCSKSNISKCCNGHIKTVRGFVFKII